MRSSSFGPRGLLLALAVASVMLWQAAFVAPRPALADDPPPLPPGYVDCGMGFVCGGDGGLPGGDPIVVTGPDDRVIQGLYLDDSSFASPVAAWAFLENEAKAYLAAVHQVPVDSRLTDWARDEIRAYMFARLLEIAKDPGNNVANPPAPAECSTLSGAQQRTCHDQVAYHTLKVLTQKARIRAAQNSVDEYYRWYNDPCAYDWPAPLTGAPSYQSRSDIMAYCSNPNIGLFTGAIPPTKEEFTGVGTAMEFASLAAPEALAVTSDWNAAGGFLGALGGAAVAAAIAAAIVATVPAVSSLFVTGGALVIFPFAAYGTAAAAAGGAAAGVGAFTAVLGVASAVFIAVVGAVLAGIAIWQQVEQSKIIIDLEDTLDNRINNAPDLADMASTEKGVGFLGAVFTRETLPDYGGLPYRVPGTPAHTSTDPDFINVGHDVSGSMVGDPDSATITPRDWTGNAHTAYVTDGWWSDQKGANTPTYATRIQYVDWNGQNRYAGVAGGTFIHSKPDGSDSSVSPTINYVDFSGVKRTATIHRNEPPTLAPTATGSFVEGEPLTFNANASDPEGGDVTVTWRLEDPRGQLIDFVVNGESTLQKCYTNPLNQGAVPGQLFFGCPWPTQIGQSTEYTYLDSGKWHVNVVATDDHGISRNTVFEVNIQNVDPTLTLDVDPPTGGDEGTAEVTVSGEASDPGDDPLAVTVDWGDGTTDTQFFPCDWTVALGDGEACIGGDLDGQLRVRGAADPSQFELSHTYLDDNPAGGPWPISITVIDDDGGSSEIITSANVDNVAPTQTIRCGELSPPGPIGGSCFIGGGDTRYGFIGDPITVSGLFDDPGDDEFALDVSWGDGTADQFAYPCEAGPGCPFGDDHLWFPFPTQQGRTAFKLTHAYQSAGDFPISISISDDDDGAAGPTVATARILAYPFTFVPPIVTPPDVNQLAGGDKIRVWFSLGGPRGRKVTRGVARHRPVDCTSGAALGRWTTSRMSKVAYRPKRGQYYFVWFTRPAWTDSCREVLVRLNDGTRQTLLFELTAPG